MLVKETFLVPQLPTETNKKIPAWGPAWRATLLQISALSQYNLFHMLFTHRFFQTTSWLEGRWWQVMEKNRRILQLVLAVLNMPSCLEQIKHFVPLTNCGKSSEPFLSWQELERCTNAINNSNLWDDFSVLTLTAEKTRYGLACMSRCMSVLCSGWVSGDRDPVLWNWYVSCLPLLPTWELPLKQQSSTNSLSYKPIGCHLLKIHWEAAREVDKYGKVYLFHCVKVSQSVKVMPPWKCINYSSCCTNLIFNK